MLKKLTQKTTYRLSEKIIYTLNNRCTHRVGASGIHRLRVDWVLVGLSRLLLG